MKITFTKEINIKEIVEDVIDVKTFLRDTLFFATNNSVDSLGDDNLKDCHEYEEVKVALVKEIVKQTKETLDNLDIERFAEESDYVYEETDEDEDYDDDEDYDE